MFVATALTPLMLISMGGSGLSRITELETRERVVCKRLLLVSKFSGLGTSTKELDTLGRTQYLLFLSSSKFVGVGRGVGVCLFSVFLKRGAVIAFTLAAAFATLACLRRSFCRWHCAWMSMMMSGIQVFLDVSKCWRKYDLSFESAATV